LKNNNEILIASSNKGKIKEFKNLFKEYKNILAYRFKNKRCCRRWAFFLRKCFD